MGFFFFVFFTLFSTFRTLCLCFIHSFFLSFQFPLPVAVYILCQICSSKISSWRILECHIFILHYLWSNDSAVFWSVLVYDVTRRESFTNLSDIWANEVELYLTDQDCVKMLVGNKVDRVSLSWHTQSTFNIWWCLVSLFFPPAIIYIADLRHI